MTTIQGTSNSRLCSIRNRSFWERLPILLGLTLTTLFVLQAVLDLRWEALYALQQSFVYKQVSGILFVLVVLWQWRLYFHRESKSAQSIREILYTHRLFGSVAPFMLYLHAMDFGYALQAVLSISFLCTVVSGVLSPQVWRSRPKLAVSAWVVFHVFSASLMLGMVIYHVYVMYWYG